MKKGFTLAEVLITLGIIGIVAAMTIPTLLQKNYERQTVVKLRQTQSILTQAIRMTEEEYGDIENWGIKTKDVNSIKKAADNLKHFLKIAIDCGTNDVKGHCVPTNGYRTFAGGIDSVSKGYRTSPYYYKMSLLNGTSIWFVAPDPKTYGAILWFYVDTNGKSLPNTIGKDLFLFSYYNKSLYPEGGPNSPYARECSMNRSWGCAYYVLHNNNMNYLRKIK